MKTPSIPFTTTALLCLFLILPGLSCSSVGGSGSGAFASVTIPKHSVNEIAVATVQVFAEDGYRGGATGSGKLLFEKLASRGTTISREGLIGAAYGAQTINRVKVEIVELSEGVHSLECEAFVVTGGSDPFFQNEARLTNARSGPYQSLLKKVAKRLEGTQIEKAGK